jgi:hypothetical protein
MSGVIVLVTTPPPEVTRGVRGQLVRRRGAERLSAQPGDRGHGDERHGELGVQPLDLDTALFIGVEGEARLLTGILRPAGDAATRIGDAVQGVGVAEAGLAPDAIDLEA